MSLHSEKMEPHLKYLGQQVMGLLCRIFNLYLTESTQLRGLVHLECSQLH